MEFMENKTYIALLRGINVSGHHKVPMAELKVEMQKLGFTNIISLLNTGNVIFEAKQTTNADLEDKISRHLEKIFGFPIPTMIQNTDEFLNLVLSDPFKKIDVKKETRLYITFFKTSTLV